MRYNTGVVMRDYSKSHRDGADLPCSVGLELPIISVCNIV